MIRQLFKLNTGKKTVTLNYLFAHLGIKIFIRFMMVIYYISIAN